MNKKELLLELRNLQIGSFELVDNEYLLIITICGCHYRISDEGQSCCETRWMTCDDNLDMFKGSIIKDIELFEDESVEDENGDCDDVKFLRIVTTLGDFRICMHNKHNGYYGGFDPCYEKSK